MDDDSILAIFTGVSVGAAGVLFGIVGLNEPIYGALMGIGLLGLTSVGVYEAISNQTTTDHRRKQNEGFTARLLTKNRIIVLLSLLLLGIAGAGITLTGI